MTGEEYAKFVIAGLDRREYAKARKVAGQKRKREEPKLHIELLPKQEKFVFERGVDEIMYGGAAGGGKSAAQCIAALLYAIDYPGSTQLMLRRTFVELEGSLIKEHFKHFPWEPWYKYNSSKHVGTLWNGSTIRFGYCASENDVFQYQGAEFDVIRLDEATHFTYVTAVPPYGYRFENRQYVIVPEEAETVRTIYALYLSGVGCHAIATRLNAEQAGGRVDWNPELIKYILLNERYIGDALMQKRFTPSVLPLRSRRNRGEVPKYYYRDSHDAIISRADYEAVQALWKKRQEKYAKGGQMKTDCWLRKKLICRYCGRSYRLVVCSAPPRWVCSEKSIGGRQCPCRSYLTDEVGVAFVCLYNRLRQNTDVILDDTLNQLERLQTRVHAGNPELQALDGDALVLADQICRYSGLHAKGILDEVTYREQTDRLERKLSALRARRSKLIGEDAQEKCVEELRSLKRMLSAMPDSMQIFDRSAFDRLITKIYAEPDGALTFALPGGLQLRLEESEWRSE